MAVRRRNLTFEGDPSRRDSRVMTALVIITIIVVAYWAVNGGIDRIELSGDGTILTVDE